MDYNQRQEDPFGFGEDEFDGYEELPENHVKSIISSIVIPLLIIGVCVVIYAFYNTSILGLTVGVVLSVALGVVMFVCGIYFLPIPLPFITVSFMGFDKTHDSLIKVILFSLLSFGLAVAAVLAALFM